MRIISSAWPASCSNAGFASSKKQVPSLQQVCSIVARVWCGKAAVGKRSLSSILIA